jgi:hypothetical protein
VTPGQYSVQARAVIRKVDPAATAAANAAQLNGRGGRGGPGGFGPGGPGGAIAQILWAATDVTVSGQKPPDVVLNLQPGMTVSGRVDFQGSLPPPADLTRVRITLSSRGSQTFDLGAVPPADVDATGRFVIAGVAPGRYVLSGTVPAAQTAANAITVTTQGAAAATGGAGRGGRGGAGAAAAAPGTTGRGGGFGAAATTGTPGTNGQWVLKSAMVNGRDSLDFPFEITPNQDAPGATLVFTDRTQTLSGTIQDSSGRATSDYTIIVFPSDSNYWLPQARRIASSRPGTDGRFSFGSLPAGSYRLTAVTDVEPGEWYDPTFLTQLVPASIPISLADGEKKIQDIKVAGGG